MDTPSTLKEELAAIDIRVAELKENIKLGEALARLHEEPDFMHVILTSEHNQAIAIQTYLKYR